MRTEFVLRSAASHFDSQASCVECPRTAGIACASAWRRECPRDRAHATATTSPPRHNSLNNAARCDQVDSFLVNEFLATSSRRPDGDVNGPIESKRTLTSSPKLSRPYRLEYGGETSPSLNYPLLLYPPFVSEIGWPIDEAGPPFVAASDLGEGHSIVSTCRISNALGRPFGSPILYRSAA